MNRSRRESLAGILTGIVSALMSTETAFAGIFCRRRLRRCRPTTMPAQCVNAPQPIAHDSPAGRLLPRNRQRCRGVPSPTPNDVQLQYLPNQLDHSVRLGIDVESINLHIRPIRDRHDQWSVFRQLRSLDRRCRDRSVLEHYQHLLVLHNVADHFQLDADSPAMSPRARGFRRPYDHRNEHRQFHV